MAFLSVPVHTHLHSNLRNNFCRLSAPTHTWFLWLWEHIHVEQADITGQCTWLPIGRAWVRVLAVDVWFVLDDEVSEQVPLAVIRLLYASGRYKLHPMPSAPFQHCSITLHRLPPPPSGVWALTPVQVTTVLLSSSSLLTAQSISILDLQLTISC